MSWHTPGPWEANGHLTVWAVSPWNARVCIADVTNFSPMNAIDSEANARLIAAAPDLLEALIAARDGANFPFSKPKLMEQVNAAIARATGETP